MRNKLIVIVGPTSSGKTKLAVDLAREFNGEIVSADSRQVYKGMDIGTGKDLEEYGVFQRNAFSRLQGSSFVRSAHCRRSQCRSNALRWDTSNKVGGEEVVVYHLIDIVSPKTNFTLAQYQKKAYRVIDDILARGKLPILVGGTGLYVSAVVDGYVLPKAPPDPKLRLRLAKLSLAQLCAKLRRLDPVSYRVIDKYNRRRLERAIEICLTTGVPFSKQRIKRAPQYKVLMIGIAVPKPELHRRIDKRLRERLKQGMIEEVARLHKQGVTWKRLESFGVEYRDVSRYLRGLCGRNPRRRGRKSSSPDSRGRGNRGTGGLGMGNYSDDNDYETMTRELARAIKHFARRQMTWFKRDERIRWIKNKKEAGRLAKRFLQCG